MVGMEGLEGVVREAQIRASGLIDTVLTGTYLEPSRLISSVITTRRTNG